MYRKTLTYLLVMLFVFTSFFLAPNYVSAEVSWNNTLGRFVSTSTVVKETANEQYEYANSLRDKSDWKGALKAYEILFRVYPDTLLAQEALIQIAALYEQKKDYKQAFKNYQQVIELYPHTERSEEIIEKQFKIGNVFLGGEKGRFLGLPVLPAISSAIEVFEGISKSAPFSIYGRKAQFQLGLAYKKKGSSTQAIEAFKTFMHNFPTSDLMAEAQFQIAEITFSRAMRKRNDEAMLISAKDILDNFIRNYPLSRDVKKAAQMIVDVENSDAKRMYDVARFYEDDSYLESAAVCYEELILKYPDNQWSNKAKVRLDSFSDPAKFLNEGRASLDARLVSLKNERMAILKIRKKGTFLDSDADKLSELESAIKSVKADIKRIEKDKRKETNLRWEVLRRKKRDLKDRQIKLRDKEKILKQRPSDDLENALKRWKASLEAERYALSVEEKELLALERKLGIRRIFSAANVFLSAKKDIMVLEGYKEKTFKNLCNEQDYLEKEFNSALDTFSLLDAEVRSVKAVKQQIAQKHDMLKNKSQDKVLNNEILEKERLVLDTLNEKLRKRHADLEVLENAIGPLDNALMELANVNLKHDSFISRKNVLAADLGFLKKILKEMEDGKEFDKSLINKMKSDAQTQKNVRKKERAFRRAMARQEKLLHKVLREVSELEEQKASFIIELEDALEKFKDKKCGVFSKSLNVVCSPLKFVAKGTDAFIFGLKNKEQVVVNNADKVKDKALTLEEKAVVEGFEEQIKKTELSIKEKNQYLVKIREDLDSFCNEKMAESAVDNFGSLTEKVDKDVIIRKIETFENKFFRLDELIEENQKEIENFKAVISNIEEDSEFGSKVEGDLREDLDVKKKNLQEDIVSLQTQIKVQEQILDDIINRLPENAENAVFSKKGLKRIVKKYNKKNAVASRELKELKADRQKAIKVIINIAERREALYKKHKSFLQDKINYVNKRLKRYEKYDSVDIDSIKANKKNVYKELDRVATLLAEMHQLRMEYSDML